MNAETPVVPAEDRVSLACQEIYLRSIEVLSAHNLSLMDRTNLILATKHIAMALEEI
jgi:hypothetical protein